MLDQKVARDLLPLVNQPDFDELFTLYLDNKKKRVKQVYKTKLHRKRVSYRMIIEHYFSKGCVDCGEKDVRVLEFDHVRGVKRRFKNRRGEGVAYLVRCGYAWPSIKKEIDKCEVRCCNCHKLKTFKQFNYLKDLQDIYKEYLESLEQSKDQ